MVLHYTGYYTIVSFFLTSPMDINFFCTSSQMVFHPFSFEYTQNGIYINIRYGIAYNNNK